MCIENIRNGTVISLFSLRKFRALTHYVVIENLSRVAIKDIIHSDSDIVISDKSQSTTRSLISALYLL